MRNTIKKCIKKIHALTIHTNRVSTISNILVQNIPTDVASVLDIGCGDGLISKEINTSLNKLSYTGIDVMDRPTCYINYVSFDGVNIPFKEQEFDAVQLIDVLHHTDDIQKVLENALKYTNKYVIIKDHIYLSKFDFLILKFMDWVGNAPHGVKVIYNFQKEITWDNYFSKLSLKKVYFNKQIKLYPWYVNWIFGRELHFIAILKKN
ncbi:MAG: methyltransferase domain-containing protein [Bacteroidia bacterium]|nr:methyltransferase domain-containing protein [Bacteroidia bacterium]